VSRPEVRVVFLHQALANRHESERIASKGQDALRREEDRLTYVPLHHASLMDSAASFRPPLDEGKSEGPEKGQGRKTSTLDTKHQSSSNPPPPSPVVNKRDIKTLACWGISEGNRVQNGPKWPRIENSTRMSHTTSSPALGHPAAHQCSSFSIGIPFFHPVLLSLFSSFRISPEFSMA